MSFSKSDLVKALDEVNEYAPKLIPLLPSPAAQAIVTAALAAATLGVRALVDGMGDADPNFPAELQAVVDAAISSKFGGK